MYVLMPEGYSLKWATRGGSVWMGCLLGLQHTKEYGDLLIQCFKGSPKYTLNYKTKKKLSAKSKRFSETDCKLLVRFCS